MDNYSSQNINDRGGGKSGILIGLAICAVCAVIGLGLGILNAVQVSQMSQKLDGFTGDLYGEAVEDDFEESQETACVLPNSADDINYLIVAYNKGVDSAYVDAENKISYYTTSTNSDGDKSSIEQIVQTDTSKIMQQVFQNGLSNFGNYDKSAYTEEGDVNWNWVAELETKNGSTCQVGGNETSPTWFNTLVELVNSKK